MVLTTKQLVALLGVSPAVNDGSTRCATTLVNERGGPAMVLTTILVASLLGASFTRLIAQRVDPSFTAG
jgi:hypothetical protein